MCLSANIDADVFIQFVEPVLETGDRREVWSPHIGEVRAWVVALDEAQIAERISRASDSLGAKRQVVEIMIGERHRAFAHLKIPLHIMFQGSTIDRLAQWHFGLLKVTA